MEAVKITDTGICFLLGYAKRKGFFEHAQNVHLDSSRACAKSHPGICSPLVYFIMSNEFVSSRLFYN